MKKNNKSKIDIILEKIFLNLNNRQIKALNYRFGLNSGKELTLQEIGDKLNITRERARQIIKRSLDKIKYVLKSELNEILVFTEEYLKRVGGLRLEDTLLKDVLIYFKDNSKFNYKKLKFFYLAINFPLYYKEDENFRSFLYLDKDSLNKIKDFNKNLLTFFKTKDKNEILEKKFYLEIFKFFSDFNFISILKNFSFNAFGDFGLVSWSEIKPKNIRDKVYLILKKTKKPLHFKDIVREINKYKFDKKKAYFYTVHNELIKDDRFVLVGRGVYGLKEDGYLPGTVKELISYFLKKHGPLTKDKIIELINQQRILKRQTIILNLQNSKNFKRLADGRYFLKEV